jgi:hypothetical protein
VLVAFVGCKDEVVVDRNLTGIELTVSYDTATAIDQIEISGMLDDGTEAFARGRLPETPRALTEGENTLVLLLRDDLAGRMIAVSATGLQSGAPISSGEVSVMTELKQLVPAGVLLAVVPPIKCTDADNDTFGEGCDAPDCDDTSDRCTTTCADADADTIFDCKDDCIDGDGDRFGLGTGCLGADCNDLASTCTSTCTGDLDSDTVADCADRCLDPDGDDYGMPGAAGNDCLGTDCDEQTPMCNLDCTTDLDQDGTIDCRDDCIDGDDDGSCAGIDCDDTAATCTTDCATDADLDSIPDCKDDCMDADGDLYGTGTGCSGLDCDDTAAACTTDCTADVDGDALADCNDPCLDADGDGFGMNGPAGTCTGADCDETRVACNSDCVACLPQSLTLTSNSPQDACNDATLTIDLGGYDNAAGALSCSAPRIPVLPLENFATGQFNRWDARSNNGDVSVRTFPDGFPLLSCTTFNFVRINDRGPDYFELATPIDATNLRNLSVRMRVGFQSGTNSGDDLSVDACCGSGCPPASVSIIQCGSSGGTDECSDYEVMLPAYADDCDSLQIRFSYPNASASVAIDSIQVFGDLDSFGTFSETSPGVYSSMFRACEPTTVPVTCAWNDGANPPLSDSTNVVFQ